MRAVIQRQFPKTSSRCVRDFGTQKSLFIEINSLFLPEKFPVPLGREFSCKRLNLLADWAPKSQMQAAIGEIPCKIPC